MSGFEELTNGDVKSLISGLSRALIIEYWDKTSFKTFLDKEFKLLWMLKTHFSALKYVALFWWIDVILTQDIWAGHIQWLLPFQIMMLPNYEI